MACISLILMVGCLGSLSWFCDMISPCRKSFLSCLHRWNIDALRKTYQLFSTSFVYVPICEISVMCCQPNFVEAETVVFLCAVEERLWWVHCMSPVKCQNTTLSYYFINRFAQKKSQNDVTFLKLIFNQVLKWIDFWNFSRAINRICQFEHVNNSAKNS